MWRNNNFPQCIGIYYMVHFHKGLYMPQSLAKIYVHVVFATKFREPMIKQSRLKGLHGFIAAVCRENVVEAYRVGGIEDHVHLLIRLPQTMGIAKVVEIVKSRSSKWMKDGIEGVPGFRWQDGYGAFSVSESHVDSVIAYIDNQAEHHHSVSYKEEACWLAQ